VPDHRPSGSGRGRGDPRQTGAAFEETLRRRLADTLEQVEGPHPDWATAPARARVEGSHRSAWHGKRRPVLAVAASLVLVGLGLSVLVDGMRSPANSPGPAASGAYPSGPAATQVETPAASGATFMPSASPTLGPCPSWQTPGPSACLKCRCEPSPSPSPS
jgi:hypothetical protein